MIRNFRHAEPGEIIERAKVLKNIGQVCREARISRQTYYRWRWLYRTGRRDALKKRSRRRPHPKRRMLSIWETTIINLALNQPTWSAQRVAAELHGQEMPVSVSGVRCVWLRHGLLRKSQRLAAACARETQVPTLAGIHGVLRLVPIKGIGGVVQHTFIDGHSHLARARVYLDTGNRGLDADPTPRGITFIRDDVLPFFVDQKAVVGRIQFARSQDIMPRSWDQEYKCFLDDEDIGHRYIRSGSEAATLLQRLHDTELHDFLLPAIRSGRCSSLKDLQSGLDEWVRIQNEEVERCGAPWFGRTAMATFKAMPRSPLRVDARPSQSRPRRG